MLDRTSQSRNCTASCRPAPIIWPALKPYADQPLWVVWQYVTKEDGAKTKIPFQARNPSLRAKSSDKKTWATLSAAIRAYDNTPSLDGIGLCCLGTDLVALDLDGCRSQETGLLHPWVEGLVTRAQTYTEITPSSTGLRIIGRGTGPEIHKSWKAIAGMGECALHRKATRYITVTGNVLPGAPHVLAALDQLADAVVAELDALKGQRGAEAEAEAEAPPGDAQEIPRSLAARLFVPNTGAGEPHGGYPTRSELMFAFITDALRAGIKGKAIVAACLDEAHRGHAVYEHCRSGGLDYVKRQIRQARLMLAEGVSAQVAEVNKTYALVLAGNKSAVMYFEKIDGREQFRLLQIGSFKDWYANHPVTIGKGKTSLGHAWIAHKARRQYSGIEFAPNGGREGYYNLWRGFSVEPRKGDCSKFLAHLEDNVAQGNKEHYNWILGWFAQIVKEPQIKPGTAVVLRGPQGVGKTIVGQLFGSLFVDHYELVAEPRYVTGRFNATWQACYSFTPTKHSGLESTTRGS
jgi:hypothetical protein